MNIPEKTRRFLPLLSFLWVCASIPLSAQNWQEYRVLNQDNALAFSRTILFNPNLILDADPAIGDVILDVDGSTLTITFEPTLGAVGVAEFIVEYFPNQFPPAPRIEAFRVFVGSSFVITQKDFFSVVENSMGNTLPVLENDSTMGNTLFTISNIAAQKNGVATISPDNQSIAFTPNPDFTGMAYITYVACDELGACAKGEVNVNVTTADIPATDTIYLSTHSRASVIAVTPLTGFAVSEDPVNGTVTNLSPDTWEYTPDDAFDGADEFTLTKDGYTRHVIVDVYLKEAPNTYANADRVFTRIDDPVTFDVLANDIRQYPIDAYTQPAEGTLVFDSLGYFTYTPDSAFFGAQTFTYTTCFLTVCETAEVIIYVGEMIPENTETYHLVTRKDVPLVLNYEIPLDGYDFVVYSNPTTGVLDLYEGTQSIPVLCSIVEGYDLLIYESPAGYVGNDYFEVVYCNGDSPCHLVKVDVEVQDGETMPCPCVDRCVWPGDADGSGQVNMNDLLNIGWQLGYTGPDRDYPDNTAWMGQNGEDWPGSLWGMNSKYADSDGNGVIAENDVTSINEYYLRAHTLIPEITGLKADYAFEIIPLVYELDSGDLAMFEIVIGSEDNPVLDMHGLSFSLNLPEGLIDSASVAVDFYNDSWLGHDAATMHLQKQPHGGRLDAAFTRTSGKPASGTGAIGILTFIVTDDFEGFKTPDGRVPLRIGINSVSSMASNGMLYDVDGTGAVVYFDANSVQQKLPLEDMVFLYPNPSGGDQVTLHANGDRTLKQIEVFDLSGSQIHSYNNLTTKQYSPDISGLHNGLYFMRVTTTDGVVTKKFEVVKNR